MREKTNEKQSRIPNQQQSVASSKVASNAFERFCDHNR